MLDELFNTDVLENSLFRNAPQNLIKQSSYYYVGHFSKYVRPGSMRIKHENANKNIQSVAFKNKDNSIAVVLMNETDTDESYVISYNGKTYEGKINKHAIHTVLF